MSSLLKPTLVSHRNFSQKKEITGGARKLFPSPNNPLYVDLGCGQGEFINEACKLHPKINWMGIDIQIVYLLEAGKTGGRNHNSHYVWADIEQLPDIFLPNEVNRFYINMPLSFDELTSKQSRKRLTHRRFLNKYKELLHPDGDLILKTEGDFFYQWTVNEFTLNGWELVEQIEDLHDSPYIDQNIQTKWEGVRIWEGCNIYYAKFRPIK